MIVKRKSGYGKTKVLAPKAKKSTQKLTGDKILQLAKIIKNIEKHYNSAYNIE